MHIKAGASDPAHVQNGLAELQTTDAMTATAIPFKLVQQY